MLSACGQRLHLSLVCSKFKPCISISCLSLEPAAGRQLFGVAHIRALMERVLRCLWARMSLQSLTPLHHSQPRCCRFQQVTQSAPSRASRHRCDKQQGHAPWGVSASMAHPAAIQGCCQPGFDVPHTLCWRSRMLCFVGGRRFCPWWFIEHVSAAHFS